MVPRGKEPGDGGIQGGGGVGGKADPLRRAVEELPQQQPRLIDAAPGVQGLAVGPSPGLLPKLPRAESTACRHHRGLSRRGGGIVQIDHGWVTFPALARVSTMAYILVTPPTASFSVRP